MTDEFQFGDMVMTYMTHVGRQLGLDKQISLRGFADELSIPLIENDLRPISHQSIQNWANNKHLPNRNVMRTVMMTAKDDSWQIAFANDAINYLDRNN